MALLSPLPFNGAGFLGQGKEHQSPGRQVV